MRDHATRLWRRKVPDIFTGTSTKARTAFQSHAVSLIFRSRAPVAADGEQVFLLEQGRVKQYRQVPGGQTLVSGFCLPGDIFGAVGAVRRPDPAIPGLSSVAVGRCVVSAIPRDRFQQLLEMFPRLRQNVLAIMEERLSQAIELASVAEITRPDVRLAVVLLACARQCGVPVEGGVLLDMPVTRQEFVDLTNVGRHQLTRIFQQLERQGWLTVVQRRLLLRQPGALARLVHEAQATIALGSTAQSWLPPWSVL